MSDPIFGIKVYMDGAELDCEQYGNVKVSVGPFSPLNNGGPHRCSVDIYDTWDGPGASYTECWVLLVCEDLSPGSGSTFTHYVGEDIVTGEWCVPLFKGKIAQRQGRGPATHLGQRVIRYDFFGEESMIFNRRTSISANNNSGSRALVRAIATDISYADNGTLGWPDATHLNMDQPAQDKTSIGSFLKTVCAAIGNWVTCEWSWDGLGAPGFTWRPAYFSTHSSVDPANQEVVQVNHGWLFDFRQVGIAFTDVAGKVVVNGRNSAGTDKSGSDTITTPSLVGSRVAQVTTFIDNDSDCATAAARLASRCDPARNRIQDVTISLEAYWRGLWYDSGDFDTVTDDVEEPLARVLQYGVLRPGDVVGWKVHPYGVTWPAKAQPIVDEFTAMLGPWDDVDIDETQIQYTLVAGCTWTWTPSWGWLTTKALEPLDADKVAALA